MSDRYTPTDHDRYQAMLKVFDVADSKRELESLMLLYVFDLSFPREDILMAAKATELAKGWR